jgi:hypothetical protein
MPEEQRPNTEAKDDADEKSTIQDLKPENVKAPEAEQVRGGVTMNYGHTTVTYKPQDRSGGT